MATADLLEADVVAERWELSEDGDVNDSGVYEWEQACAVESAVGIGFLPTKMR